MRWIGRPVVHLEVADEPVIVQLSPHRDRAGAREPPTQRHGVSGSGAHSYRCRSPRSEGLGEGRASRDDGRGIEAEDARRIFDPFFTTKTDTGAAGLGLSVRAGASCGEHGGRIQVDGQPGRGTTVTHRAATRGRPHGAGES